MRYSAGFFKDAFPHEKVIQQRTNMLVFSTV